MLSALRSMSELAYAYTKLGPAKTLSLRTRGKSVTPQRLEVPGKLLGLFRA